MFITFPIFVIDPELYVQLGATLLNKKARANIVTHAFDIDLFDDIEEGSLLVFDMRPAESLVTATNPRHLFRVAEDG